MDLRIRCRPNITYSKLVDKNNFIYGIDERESGYTFEISMGVSNKFIDDIEETQEISINFTLTRNSWLYEIQIDSTERCFDKEKVEIFRRWYWENKDEITEFICAHFREKVLSAINYHKETIEQEKREQEEVEYKKEYWYINKINTSKYFNFFYIILYSIKYVRSWKNFVVREEDEILKEYLKKGRIKK